MRIISFQGKDIWHKILCFGNTYYADITLARECNNIEDLSEDIEQLSGAIPVWGYTQPSFDYVSIWDGSLIELIRCEMSLNQDNAFGNMYLYELEVPIKEVFHGIYHNDSSYVVTFNRIEPQWIKAIYTVEDCSKGNTIEQWYCKTITNIYKNLNNDSEIFDIITSNKIDMYQLRYEDDWDVSHRPVSCTSVGKRNKCLNCGGNTEIYYKDKPVCSFTCLTKLMVKFDMAAIMYSVSGRDILDKISEKEFRENSIQDLVHMHSKDIGVHKINIDGWVCEDGKHYEWRK